MKCMKRLATEEFKEEDHPRGADGKFVKKGTSVDTEDNFDEFIKELDETKYEKNDNIISYIKSNLKEIKRYGKPTDFEKERMVVNKMEADWLESLNLDRGDMFEKFRIENPTEKTEWGNWVDFDEDAYIESMPEDLKKMYKDMKSKEESEIEYSKKNNKWTPYYEPFSDYPFLYPKLSRYQKDELASEEWDSYDFEEKQDVYHYFFKKELKEDIDYADLDYYEKQEIRNDWNQYGELTYSYLTKEKEWYYQDKEYKKLYDEYSKLGVNYGDYNERGLQSNFWNYYKGVPEKQSIKTIDRWRFKIMFANDNKSNELPEYKIPKYPIVDKRTVDEHNSILKDIRKKTPDMKKDIQIGFQNIIKYAENKEDLQFRLHSVYDFAKRVGREKSDLKELFLYEIESGNVGLDDFVSNYQRSKQLEFFSDMVTSNEDIKKMYDDLSMKMDKINHDNYDLFLKSPEFYRGTTTEELDSFIKDKVFKSGKYDFKSLSMDRKEAIGNSTDSNEDGFSCVIVFEGDEVRDVGMPIQYNPVPVSSNYTFGDKSERIDTPLPMRFLEEREVRIQIGKKIPKIKELNFGDSLSEDQKKEVLEKYSSLTDNIKFEKFMYDRSDEKYVIKSIGSESFNCMKKATEEFREEDHPRDEDGKFTKKGSSKLPKETVNKIIDKIKNTPNWKSRDGHAVSDKVETSHFLSPDGELIGNYNHQTMVSELAPMIDGFELTGKTTGGSIKQKDGTWKKLPDNYYANWNDITNFLAHTGFVRVTNGGISKRGFGHSVNLTVNGTLTNSQIRAIQRMEQTSPAGTTLVFDIMGDEKQSGHGTFRDFMKAYRKNYGVEVFREEDHPRDEDGKFTTKNGSANDENYTDDDLMDELYTGKFEEEFLEIVNKSQVEDEPDKLLVDLKNFDKYMISLTKQEDNEDVKNELRELREKRDIIAFDEKYDDVYNLKTTIEQEKMDDIMEKIGHDVINLNDIDESEIDKLTPMEKAIFNKVKRLQNKIKDNKDIRKIGWTDDMQNDYGWKDKIDYKSVLLYYINMAKSHWLSQVNKSDIMHVELYELVEDEMNKRLDTISSKYGYDVNNIEYYVDVENRPIITIGTKDDPDKWLNLDPKDKTHIEKFLQYKASKRKVENAEAYKKRIGNEVLTPMIHDGVHIYYVKEEGHEGEWMPKNGDTDLLQFAYNEMNQIKQKNYWTKDLGNPMNLTLHQGEGEQIGKIGDEIQGTAGGTWVKERNNMNIYNFHPRKSLARRSLAVTLSHELTHSVYSTRVEQAKKDKVVKEQLERLTNICENLDPVLVGKHLGTYAKSYIDEFNENGREGYGANLETEMLSAITDAINHRIYRMRSVKNVKRGLKKYFPELMKVYKELMGKDKWDNSKKREKLKKLKQNESYSYKTIVYDLQYLDDNNNIVHIEHATHGIRKGYIGNELISFEVIILNKNGTEEFREEDHPRDEDGKFTSKGNGDKSKYSEQIKLLQNDFENMHDQISRGTDKTFGEYTNIFGYKCTNQALCGSASGNIMIHLIQKTNLTHKDMKIEGGLYDKSDAKYSPVASRNKDGEPVLWHEYVRMSDGTIIDGSAGQFLDQSKEITQSEKLRIILPDDPLQKYYKGIWNQSFSDTAQRKINFIHPETDERLKDYIRKTKYGESYSNEEFREEDHPRDEDGKFTNKGSGVNKKIKDLGKKIQRNTHKDILLKYTKGYLGEQWYNDLQGAIGGKEQYEKYMEAEKKWRSMINNEPEFKKIYNELKKDVDDYNVMLEDKFENTDVFYRGTSLEELESYIKDKCIGCDFQSRYHGGEGKLYDFVSMSMNTEELWLFNKGIIIEYDAESIKNSGAKRIEYSAYPVPFMAQTIYVENKLNLEEMNLPYPHRFAGEQEVRMGKTDISEISIKKIHVDMTKIEGTLRRHVGLKNHDNSDDFFQGKDSEEIRKRLLNMYGSIVDDVVIHEKGIDYDTI